MATLNIDFNVKAVNNAERALGKVDKTLQSIQKYKININLGRSLTNLNRLNQALAETSRLYTQLNRKQTPNLTVLGSGNKNIITDDSGEIGRAIAETERYKATTQRLKAEIEELRLAKARDKQETTAAAGSYREAQQRLSALGKEIRNTAGGYKQITPQLRAQIQEYRRLSDGLKAFDREMGLNYRNIGNYSSVWSRLGSEIGSVIAGYVSLQAAIQGVGAAFRSALQSDAIQASMTFILRDADEAAARLSRVEMSAERLGLGYLGLAATYRSFIGAANASNFSLFEAERLFEAVSNAAGKLKLSNDQVQGAFRALEQMISKGNVQAEELRGQLGERIPGAFAIAARAMGVTEKQLNKMLKDGDVLAKDLLPRLATELNNTFGYDQSEKVESLQGSVNRLKNTFDVAVQDGNISKFFQSLVDGLNYSLKSLNELVNSNGWKQFIENFVMFTNPSFFGGAWSRQVNNSIKSSDDLINSQVSELIGASPETRAKIWEREKSVYQSMLAEYKSGNKEIVDDLNYQGRLVSALGKQYFDILKSNTNQQGESNELTKEQLRLIEQARKERERLENSLRKIQEENHLARLSGVDREIQQIKYRYAEEIKAAKGANDIIIALQKERVKAIINAIKGEGILMSGVSTGTLAERRSATASRLNRGPASLPDTTIDKNQIAKVELFDFSEIEEGLRRASRSFINNLSSSLQWLQETETKRFGDYLLGIGQSLFGAFDSIINNTLANQLESTLKNVFANIRGDAGATPVTGKEFLALGSGIAGQIVQGITKRTNVAGQTIGGALSGAAAGSSGGWIGAIVGLVVGGLSGLFTSSAARKQEKIQEQILEEQKKQTALQERQARLAYTSSIIGEMTNAGIVQGVSRNAFGDIEFTIEGRTLKGVLAREDAAQGRGL